MKVTQDWWQRTLKRPGDQARDCSPPLRSQATIPLVEPAMLNSGPPWHHNSGWKYTSDQCRITALKYIRETVAINDIIIMSYHFSFICITIFLYQITSSTIYQTEHTTLFEGLHTGIYSHHLSNSFCQLFLFSLPLVQLTQLAFKCGF